MGFFILFIFMFHHCPGVISCLQMCTIRAFFGIGRNIVILDSYPLFEVYRIFVDLLLSA